MGARVLLESRTRKKSRRRAQLEDADRTTLKSGGTLAEERRDPQSSSKRRTLTPNVRNVQQY